MKSADSLTYDILKRLNDVNQIIDNGLLLFKKNINNSFRFYYRGGYYNIVELKAELDSYGVEKKKLEKLLSFYEEVLQE